MLRTTAHFGLLLVIYLIGLVLTWGASIWFLFVDYAGKDWIPLLVVLPPAWTLSFWPMVGSLLLVLKIRSLHGTLEAMAKRARLNGGTMQETDRQELTDLAVELVASEQKIPRFVARWMVRPVIARLSTPRAASNAASS